MHEVRDACDGEVWDAERRDQLDVGLGRRRHGDRIPVTDVVDHPHGHASLRGIPDRAADDLRGLFGQVEVVLREVERPLRLVDERLDGVRDLDSLLTTVVQGANGERLRAQRTLTSPPNWRQRPAWKRSIRLRSTG
jgi:hypothetical protein